MSKKDLIKDTAGFNPEIINDPYLNSEEKIALLKELKKADAPHSGKGCLWILIPALIGICWLGYKIVFFWLSDYTTLGRFAIVPLAMLMVFLVKLWSDDRTGAQAGYLLRKDWRRPILYLRAFRTDGPPGIDRIEPNLHLGEIVNFKYSMETEVRQRLKHLGPLIGLAGAPGEKYFGGSARLDRMRSDNWQSMVIALMKISQALVFVVSGSTENLRWEMEQAAKLLEPSYVLFFVPKTTSPAEALAFSKDAQEIFGYPIDVQQYQGAYFLCYEDGHFRVVDSNERFQAIT